MKLVLISMVRNEADVIELFVRYHADFVDEFVIADHKSLDDTREILSELVVEGLPIRLCEVDDAAFDQARRLTELMRRAAGECRAEWILSLDADEFLVSRSGRDLRSAVEALPQAAPARLAWLNYVPTDQDPQNEPNLLERITYRREVDGMEHKKVLVPGGLAGDRRVFLSHGSHRLLKKRWGRLKSLKPIENEDLAIAHFPLRSVEQAIVKGLIAWPAVLANEKHPPEKYWNQRKMFEGILRGEAESSSWLSGFAATYAQASDPNGLLPAQPKLVQDPVRMLSNHTLRWPNPKRVTPLDAVSEMAERLGAELGALRRNEGR